MSKYSDCVGGHCNRMTKYNERHMSMVKILKNIKCDDIKDIKNVHILPDGKVEITIKKEKKTAFVKEVELDGLEINNLTKSILAGSIFIIDSLQDYMHLYHTKFDLNPKVSKIITFDLIYENEIPKLQPFRNFRFERCIFIKEIKIRSCKLKGEGFDNFYKCVFFKDVEFDQTEFDHQAGFGDSIFYGKVSFNSGVFNSVASFSSIFKDSVCFNGATFNGRAQLNNNVFNEDVSFSRATFNGFANFMNIKYFKSADFKESTFKGEFNFSSSVVNCEINFSHSTFKDNIKFLDVDFNKGLKLDDSENKNEKKASFFHENIEIKNCIINETLDLSNIYIEKKLYISGVDSEKKDGVFINMKNSNINTISPSNINVKDAPNRETFTILKYNAVQHLNQISALRYHTQEYNKHYADLKWTDGGFRDKIILAFEKYSSNFGTDPVRVFLLYLLLLAGYILTPFGIDWLGSTKENVPDWKDFVSIDIFVQKSLPVIFLKTKDLTLGLLFLSIAQSALLYELIKSLRKFSRKI